MQSPLTIHQNLLGHYQDYLSKQFKSKNQIISEGRRGLYASKGVTFQPPFLEFLFNYQTSGIVFRNQGCVNNLLPYFDGNNQLLQKFQKLVGTGLVRHELYQHQWNLLCKTLLENKHSIITTGTGSGKTESFMLPLIAYLSRQLMKHGAQNYSTAAKFRRLHNGVNERRVAGSEENFRHLRENESRAASVKAIMLFPMNALVEDQLKRIRNAFSSPEVLDILDNEFAGNRIFYGKYNGLTPGTGHYSERQLKQFYQEVSKNEKAIIDFADSKNLIGKERYEEALNYFGREVTEDGQRITGEMLNRYDMQQNPPDILITNFSMLNVTLTRSAEQDIWDKTADWLKEDGAVFHVVLDEMHLYRGSAGTEIAYSISALLERLGIAGKPEKVRFLASSASLDMDNNASEARNFVGGFFNVSPEDVDQKFHIETGATVSPTNKNSVPIDIIREIFVTLSKNGGHAVEDITLKEVSNSSFMVEMCQWYTNVEGANNRPCSIEQLSLWLLRTLDIQADVENEISNIYSATPDSTMTGYLIVNGFFLFRDLIDIRKITHSIPRIRLHLFYNNFEGLWGSTKVANGSTALFGNVYNYPKKIDVDWSKVYQLFYCEKCETSFIGGYKEQGQQWKSVSANGALPGAAGNQYYSRRITPSENSLNSDSHRAVSSDTNFLSYKDFGIFWPENQEPGKTYKKHIPAVNPRDKIAENIFDTVQQAVRADAFGYWLKAFFNPNNGEVRIPQNSNCDCPSNFIQGRQYIALGTNGNSGNQSYTSGGLMSPALQNELISNESLSAKALSQCCPSCATKKYLSPIVRGYRTGFNKTNQLFASSLFKSLKSYSPDNPPKIVSFSDSRDEAAKVAAGVEAQHFNEIVTNYLLSELNRQEFTEEEKTQVLLEQVQDGIKEKVRMNSDRIRESFDQARSESRANRRSIINRLCDELDLNDDESEFLDKLYEDYRDNTVIKASYLVNELVGDFRHGFPITGLHKYLLEKGIDVRGVYNIRPHLERQPDPKQKWFEPLRISNGIRFASDDNNIHSYYSNSTKFLKAYFLRFMFTNSIFDIESMGLGKLVPTFREPAGFPNGHWLPFIYGLVKLMGWENKYTPRLLNVDRRQFAGGQINPTQTLPAFINNYINEYNAVRGTAILPLTILSIFPSQRVILDFANDECPVEVAALRDNDLVVLCNQCTQVYSQPLSHCLNCGSRSGFTSVQASIVREKSYTGSQVHQLKDKHRLHCEELSGQTDEPFERQRNFLGLIKDDGVIKKAQEIDLLAVTTTLEVGVDIGSLQGMLMANMPPQRFNYQQRVGRVGRRGQAFSFAVTLCRSKSHDAHYFQHPDEITGAPSPTPFLNVEQPEILQRVLNKYFLAAFYRELAVYLNINSGISNWEEIFSAGDINGEFGKIKNTLPNPYLSNGQKVVNSESYVDLLDSFITTNYHSLERKYKDLLNCLRRNDVIFNQPFTGFIDNLRSAITTISAVAASSPEVPLAKALMELGHLPSYGMPTKIAYLYNHYSEGDARNYLGSDASPESMDRTIDVAIFDYAPGTVKLKDKIQYTVKAIVPDVYQVNKFGKTYWKADGSYLRSEMAAYLCTTTECNHFKLLPLKDVGGPIQTCDSCGNNTLAFNGVTAIEPRNFSIDPMDNEPSEEANVSSNNRLAISGLQPIIWEHENAEFGNIKKTYSESDSVNYIYKINKGRNNGISMGFCTSIFQGVDGLLVNANNAQPFWLYTRKNTDTLSFVVHTFLNQQFDLRIEQNLQANLEKKAVFLSAATILQRCFGDILDIDPREIEFANPDFTTISINGQPYKSFQLTFYDSHDNGSGYVRRIKELLEERSSLLELIQSSNFYRNALTTQQHGASCLSGSCYKCIRTYDNSSLHGLLDWRLGLDLIKFMSDADFELDFNEFQRYVLNVAGNRYTSNIIVDNENNKAVELIDGGNPKYLVTHPISRFDTSSYQASNLKVETKSLYSLILTL